MEKKHAFVFALLITLIIAINIHFLTLNFSPQKEKAIISRVIDGDTIVLNDSRKIRLLNINSPEKSAPNSRQSIEYINQFENKSVEIEIVGSDKYDRALARIYAPEYINLELIRQGLASKFLVEESELKDFAKAEREAILSSKGIWNHSLLFGCFKSKIFSQEEKVIISSSCNKINISSWVLKDESTKSYNFKNLEIKEITLHSGKGEDNATDIFWNSKTNVWNNDRDTLYLFDAQGNIVLYDSYGY